MYRKEIADEISKTKVRVENENQISKVNFLKSIKQKVSTFLDDNKNSMIDSIKNNKTFDKEIVKEFTSERCKLLRDFVEQSGIEYLIYKNNYRYYDENLFEGCSINATFTKIK